MQDNSFLDSNLIRTYPFVHNPEVTIPNWLLTDFRAVMLVDGYDPVEHTVYLAWVALFDGRLRAGFRTDAPSLADEELVFEFDLESPRHTAAFASSQPLLNSMVEMCGCTQEQLCNPDFTEPTIGNCGPELLCNPDLDVICQPELLCDVEITTAP